MKIYSEMQPYNANTEILIHGQLDFNTEIYDIHDEKELRKTIIKLIKEFAKALGDIKSVWGIAKFEMKTLMMGKHRSVVFHASLGTILNDDQKDKLKKIHIKWSQHGVEKKQWASFIDFTGQIHFDDELKEFSALPTYDLDTMGQMVCMYNLEIPEIWGVAE